MKGLVCVGVFDRKPSSHTHVRHTHVTHPPPKPKDRGLKADREGEGTGPICVPLETVHLSNRVIGKLPALQHTGLLFLCYLRLN